MKKSVSRPGSDRPLDRMVTAGQSGGLLASFTATRPTVAERRASGKALRRAVPRGSHSQFAPAADRPDPVEILERQNLTRVKKLVPVRYARMLASPFAFLRGSAAVMTADLAATPATGALVTEPSSFVTTTS